MALPQNNNLSSPQDLSHSLPDSTLALTDTQERVLITGDDILIEYVERLMREI